MLGCIIMPHNIHLHSAMISKSLTDPHSHIHGDSEHGPEREKNYTPLVTLVTPTKTAAPEQVSAGSCISSPVKERLAALEWRMGIAESTEALTLLGRLSALEEAVDHGQDYRQDHGQDHGQDQRSSIMDRWC